MDRFGAAYRIHPRLLLKETNENGARGDMAHRREYYREYYRANRERLLAQSKAWNAIHRQPNNKEWPNFTRLRRMVKAKDYGVSLDDIARRFGLANSKSAKTYLWYARKMLKRDMQ